MKYTGTIHELTQGGEFTEKEATINRNSVQPTIYIPIDPPGPTFLTGFPPVTILTTFVLIGSQTL